MQTLAFDGRMGASGDMLLGALLAAGADLNALAPVEDALDVTYDVGRVDRQGIEATAVSVRFAEGHDHADAAHSHDVEHDHGDQGHDHGGHGHEHEHQPHAEGHGPGRHYTEVVEVVESMDLPPAVEGDALGIFERLGRAEAAVHGTDLASTHFHEVGADDAIADVVGTCLLVADLDVERVLTTPLATGDGEVEMHHGTYPVPAPAVVELAEDADWSVRGGPVDRELLTPTGAAILAELAEGVETIPGLELDASGYGAGSADVAGRPNVLRALVGTVDRQLDREPITVLETNVDDVSPEVLGGLQETLADAGALDVTVVPTTMKKSRPGHLVTVIVAPEDAGRVARRLAEETGTLGVRESGAGHRWVADREVVTATVDVGGESYDVAVKVASAGDDVYDVSAEFDDALAVARATGRPVREIARLAESTVDR